MFRRPRPNPLGPDGQVRCPKHNILAVLRTSHQPASQNRKFWTCPERPLKGSPGEKTDADCGFFYWENEILYQPSPPTPMSPTTPSRIHSPSKRSAPYFMTPDAKAKRLKAIQDALPLSSSSSSMDVDTVPSHPSGSEPTTPTASSPSVARRARLTEEIRNSLLQSPQSHDIPYGDDIRPRTSAAPGSPRSTSRVTYNLAELNIDLSGAPDPSKKTYTNTSGPMTYNLSELNLDLSGPRIQVSRPPRHTNRGESNDRTSEDELWDSFPSLPPPPHASSPDEVAADLLPSPDMSMDKGKHRAVEQDHEEEVFWFSPPSKSTTHQNGLFSPLPSSQPQSGQFQYQIQHQHQHQPQLQSQSQSSTKVPLRIQTSVPIVSTTPSSDLTGDQIQILVQSLSGIPEYVKKLERRLLAMQKSNESKARRITELEAEIQELKSHRTG